MRKCLYSIFPADEGRAAGQRQRRKNQVYTLYYSPGTASMVVHLALLEIGVPHRLEKVDFDRDAQHDAEYLRLNPRGQVPTLVIDGKPYFESAALLMILAERHPEARLAPPGEAHSGRTGTSGSPSSPIRSGPPIATGSIRRTLARRNTRQRCAMRCVANRGFVGAGGLASRGQRPVHAGRGFSGVDLLALMYMRWSRNMPRPATEWPASAGLQGSCARDRAGRRLCDIEGLTDWRA